MIAIDLETELIAPREKVGDVYITPYVTPRPALGSICSGDLAECVPMQRIYNELRHAVRAGEYMTFWNAAFDMDVLYTHGPGDVPDLVLEAYDRGLVLDGKLLDWLLTLYKGGWDMPLYCAVTRSWSVPLPRIRSLAAAAKDLLGIELNKDPATRLGFGQYIGRFDAVPAQMRHYAAEDARVTLRVWQRLESMVPTNVSLSHDLQVRADFVAQQMDKRGLTIDRLSATTLRNVFIKDEAPLQQRLIEANLGGWAPVAGAPRAVVDEPPGPAPDGWRVI